MIVAVPAESRRGETRVALTPPNVTRLRALGAEVRVEAGAGGTSGFCDADYANAGAAVVEDRARLLTEAEVVLQVRPPTDIDIQHLQPGCVFMGFLDPFNSPSVLSRLAGRGVSAMAVELIPRTTRAQPMDALSSQANLAGYVAVILAASHLNRIFPLMMTAAGTIAAARVLVIGAGVAGLQAIATARRLGARVEACDTRPAVEEEVKSLGARFLKIDLGETGQTRDGHARALTNEQLARQREALARFCAGADVVITAAQVFGRRAPVIVTGAMLRAMRPGSVVVDLAVESGGNVESIVPDAVTDRNGVKLVGFTNLAGRVPAHASQVYSTNLANLLEACWDKEQKRLLLDRDDEITRACLVTHEGRICHEQFAALAAGAQPAAP